ncbi:MAG TPA: hypothetical protein VIR56_01950 [Solimonas sp.]
MSQVDAIYAAVMDAMQQADELGGVKNRHEYIALMERIAAEAKRRRDACAAAADRSAT